jgi:pimeloyl-ACP methyl ester carboxylesterase
MNAKTLKARSRQQYRLLGRDRKPYLSRTPGRYGGYRPGAVCLPDQCTAWNHLAFDPAQTIRLQDRLQQLTTPTVIVWGTGDIFFDERWSHCLADTVPGTRSRTSLQGGRLLLPEERPHEPNREILRLWELDQ